MGNFFNLGDYLDPIARIWGGGETTFSVSGHGRGEVKKGADSPEIKEEDAGAPKKNRREEDPEKQRKPI